MNQDNNESDNNDDNDNDRLIADATKRSAAHEDEEGVSIDEEIEQMKSDMKEIEYRKFTRGENTFYVVQDLEDYKLLDYDASRLPERNPYTPREGSLWKHQSHIEYDKGLILDEQKTIMSTRAMVAQDFIIFGLKQGLPYKQIKMSVLPTADNEV